MGENLIGNYSNNYHYKPEICHQRGKKKKHTWDGQSYSMICSNEERKNKTETYWIKYFCCRLASMKPLYKLLLQSLWKTDCNLAHTVLKKKPKQIKNPNKTTKKWIPDAICAEEGHSEGQTLSVMLGEVGKTLGCSLWQRKNCMGLERLLSC